MERRRIVEEIKRVAAANGGKAPGRLTFERATSILSTDWYPHHWLRWGDALTDAGFTPNELQAAFTDEFVIEKYIGLVQKLGHLPILGELRREKKADAEFPNEKVLDRFGGK